MANLQEVEAAAKAYAEAYETLRRTVLEASQAGIPLAKIARAADVTRPTVQRWVGIIK